MDFNVAGKTAVVTGSSRGLGFTCCEAFIKGGAKRVVVNLRKKASCDEAVKKLKTYAEKLGQKTEIYSVVSGLGDVKGVDTLVEGVKAAFTGPVDILVANAGAAWGAPFEKHPEHAFDKVMDLNVKGVFYTIQKFAPLMKKSKDEDPSRIIINASIIGLYNSSAVETYGYLASKAGVIHLGRTLALQLAPKYNINVNVICPGFFPTKMSSGMLEHVGPYYSKTNPRGRVGYDSDLEPVILFLCAKETSYINGVVLPIDGGYHLSGPLL